MEAKRIPFAEFCFNLYRNQNGIFVETLKKKKEDEESRRSHILYIYVCIFTYMAEM